MMSECIVGLVAIGIGLLIFHFADPLGRVDRALSIFRFPEPMYPFLMRCGGALAIAFGAGMVCHWAWKMAEGLLHR
jgi:hypothetical protein